MIPNIGFQNFMIIRYYIKHPISSLKKCTDTAAHIAVTYVLPCDLVSTQSVGQKQCMHHNDILSK